MTNLEKKIKKHVANISNVKEDIFREPVDTKTFIREY